MPIAAQPLPSFLSNLVLERRTMFAALIAGERIVLLEETSRIKTTALHHTVQGFGLPFLYMFVWGKLFCLDSLLYGMVVKRYHVVYSKKSWKEGSTMPEVQELWHECVRCGSIFDADTPACPPCGAEEPRELDLTLREVLEHVDPTKVWTKTPKRFYELLEERKQVLAQRELDAQAVSV
ncbi:hypothetical protein IH982_00215 [Patescibacteria group bacterium]|nr:hypothetical protein [Patescibacteria group bacterium]